MRIRASLLRIYPSCLLVRVGRKVRVVDKALFSHNLSSHGTAQSGTIWMRDVGR